MIKKYLSILFLFSLSLKVFATHNRAGEITYKHLGGLSYEITIVTYTDIGPDVSADRPELELFWGDGTSSVLPRNNGSGNFGENIGNETKKNLYTGTHTYPGPGNYRVSMEDPNRNEGVINVPGSVNLPFYIESFIMISPFGVGNYNSSPILLNPPIDNACVGRIYIHNPGAYDPDGDSLSYKLVNCKGENGAEIAGYSIPANITLNTITGDLIWNTPTMQGEFNYAILIEEWRNYGSTYIKIGSVLRDLQVDVSTCPLNDPPEIATITDTCVIANTFLTFNVTATDINGDKIALSGTGAPFLVSSSPAQFTYKIIYPPVVTSFNWQTNCSHVRLQPYAALFKAVDNGGPNLSTYKTVNIRVIAPPVLNPQASPQGNAIKLDWDKSTCNGAVGYDIYRKNGFYGYVPSNCETGVPAYTGYQLIGSVGGWGNNSFLDNNGGVGLMPGFEYCYMIVAVFEDGSESIASEEVCTSLKKDLPVITNVSVVNTSESDGEIYLAWSKPTELDTIQHSGPFKYYIFHSSDSFASALILIDSTDALLGLNDTVFNHTGINTRNSPHSYRIDLYNVAAGNHYFIGSSYFGPSIFLKVSPESTGNKLKLSWNNNVPWVNSQYVIFKQNPVTLGFDSLNSTNQTFYVDTGLVNGETYCYLVKTIGAYSFSGIINPIVNFSQESCGIPVDVMPPCPPLLTIAPNCLTMSNSLIWTNPNGACEEKDALRYIVYYKAFADDSFEMLQEVNNLSDTTLLHNNGGSIAGCYYVSAIDQFGNESILSDSVCVDNCPVYELPNVFTPDADGANDLFVPLDPYRYIESINIKMFNRWGQLVFESNNLDINWNGVNQFTNKICPEGVYFYVCKVNEIRLVGIVQRNLQGYIHLFRNGDTVPAAPTTN